jgi:anthranilate synthase/aminodeoxychorismate synthase-like glutamine amidotransferase
VTTLIVDNYDSFTWNLFQLFGALEAEPRVVRNDAVTLDDIRRIAPTHLVLSPGPGHPDDPARIGVCRAILEADLGVPILGVCLGHQAIVSIAGGRIVQAPRLMHGKTSLVEHDGDGILKELPRPFEAMRYHSLTADPASLPDSLVVTAWCKDGTIMGVRHRRRPIFGVQFHPESIGTVWGPALCRAFLRGDQG